MGYVFIDFETRSSVDIRKTGSGKYCNDASTEILCYCYAIDKGEVIKVANGNLAPLMVLALEGYQFVAHNALFEQGVWRHVTKENPPEFICTMALAQAHGLPASLDRCAKSLGLKFEKEISGQRLINMYCKPNKENKFNPLRGEDMKAMLHYCAMDVEVEREIFNSLPQLLPQEQEIYSLTQRINHRGILIDQDLASKAYDLASVLQKKANSRLKELTDNKFHSLTQTVRLRNYLNKQYGLELESVSSDELVEVLPTVVDPIAREIIELRLAFGRSSTAKFDKALQAVCDDGRIRNYLTYHGASTGRWSSTTVQLQNLPRGIPINVDQCVDLIKTVDAQMFEVLYGDPIGAITSCVRGLFLAEPGKKFFIADYSAIEARVLVWLAEQKDAVRMFHEGADIYVEMAKVIYNNKNLTKADKEARQLGKQATLGCGFGMSYKKFQATCESYQMPITEELAIKAVDAYRSTFRQVVSFWHDLEHAALSTLRTAKPHVCGPVRFRLTPRFLYCRLPSGRELAYYRPGIEKESVEWNRKGNMFYYTQDSQTHTFKKVYTYGGKLCENITQAVARDIMASAMVKLEKEGFPIVLSVHDEIVVEDDPSKKLTDVIKHMTTLPEWAHGCPINAEGFVTERYRK